MCTGRVDLSFIFRALSKGADGVVIGGCWPGECHYVTEGNYDALGNVYLAKKLLRAVGISPERLRLEWISAAEGQRFAEVMTDFSNGLGELGPLGRVEELGPEDLRLKLEAIDRLVPYLKLVERERLRLPERSEAAYQAFYTSEETDRLLDALVGDELAISQILVLLEQRDSTTAEIAERLGLEPSAASRYIMQSSRQGLVRYDAARKCYTLARARQAG
jgi:coenzyme F420-reducing hydrogenase delta subunit